MYVTTSDQSQIRGEEGLGFGFFHSSDTHATFVPSNYQDSRFSLSIALCLRSVYWFSIAFGV